VAHAIGSVEAKYNNNTKEVEEEFFKMLSSLKFLPNTPTLMNAGTELGQLSACFVLPIDDSLQEIFEALKWTAIIHQSGGGTGFDFSKLRPQGDQVTSLGITASGPVMFMTAFDKTTEIIKQGRMRRGANMGILRVDHPDILKFITCKSQKNFLNNFNISVAVTDKFMNAVKNHRKYSLVNPRNKTMTTKLNANQVFDLMAKQAWKTGDPGIIFIDEINRKNPTPLVGRIEATNPCITGDTLIFTDQGLRPIRKLVENFDVGVATISESQQLLFKRAIAFKTGTKATFKIKTDSGYEIQATSDHKFLTEKGWKKLKDLTTNDRLILQSSEGKFNKDSKLPFTFNDKKEWDRTLGQIMGWLIGDGWLRNDKKNCRVGFSFGGDDKEIFYYLKPIINQLYGYDIKEVLRANGVLDLSYHSKYFVEFFEKLGMMPWQSATKQVPLSIFTATREAVIGFLQGLFSSDGTVGCNKKKGNYYIRLTSTSEKLLKQTQLLLLNLGIKSKIYDRRKKRSIAFRYTTIDGQLRLYKSDGLIWELQISKEMIPIFLEKVGFLCNKNTKKLAKMKSVNFHKTVFSDRVLRIEQAGIVDVYDMTEPQTHSFIANGIIVHNCSEQPLLPWESCNLGSINLTKVICNGKINWKELRRLVRLGVRFLDNVIDANRYPNQKIETMTRANRKIGLGVMGFADALIKMNIPYNTTKAVVTARKIMKFIQNEGHKASQQLGKERGSFPNFQKSIWKKRYKYMRNATVTTIAPTGTISIIAGCSSGIEPLFAVSFIRNVMEGTKLLETNPLFMEFLKKAKMNQKLLMKIAETGSVQKFTDIPKNIRKIFVTAHDISPTWHVKMQAAFQKYTDNGVSKTINLPPNSSPYQVRNAYLLAHKMKCKGITVYRYGSKPNQTLTFGKLSRSSKRQIVADSEFAGGCDGVICPH
jgi:ribonucleoside-diphosphate reductase alpha chain